MNELLKKITLAGIGITSMGKEKIEEMAEELIKRGELKKEEANDAIKKAIEKSEEIKKSFEDKIASLVKTNLERFNLGQGDKISKLEERIKALEEKIEKLENQ